MKLKRVLFLLLVTVTTMANAGWEPPENPDPQEILNQAQIDKDRGKYVAALEKHVWFHEHALEYDRSFYGVRLSFALAYWVELAEVYKPALSALIAISDRNEKKVKSATTCCHDAFHDFASINRELGEFGKVVKLFKWLDANKPDSAKRNFDLAQPALIRLEEFALCGKYVDPVADYREFEKAYTRSVGMAKEPRFGSEMKEFAEKSFINSVTTLVAILAINARDEEASAVVEKSLMVMNNDFFNAEINSALLGNMPAPWP